MKKLLSFLLLLVMLPCIVLLSACGKTANYKLTLGLPSGIELAVNETALKNKQNITSWKQDKTVGIYVYGNVVVSNLKVFENNKELEIELNQDFVNGSVSENEKQLYGTVVVKKVTKNIKLSVVTNFKQIEFLGSSLGKVTTETQNLKFGSKMFVSNETSEMSVKISAVNIDETKSLYLKVGGGFVTLFDAINNIKILPEYSGSERYLQIQESNVNIKICYKMKGSSSSPVLVENASEIKSVEIEFTAGENTKIELYQ